MANNKQRYINTKFWNDNYISDLDPIEKLLFIYFLTNEHTNISGIYEMPLKVMSIETGIELSMINKILPRLKDRIRYIDGRVVIKNFVKHQETSSANVKIGILNCLKELENKFIENIVKHGYFILPQYYCDTLCIPYVEGRNYSYSNLHSNSYSNKDITSNKFDDFWKEYPVKKEKKKALKSWLKIDPSLRDKIIINVSVRREKDKQWIAGYIPHPTTYLNGERWEDEFEVEKDYKSETIIVK
ncbi:MAG: hypothetical protein WC055_14675 [Melioribacteraceae bacterium]